MTSRRWCVRNRSSLPALYGRIEAARTVFEVYGAGKQSRVTRIEGFVIIARRMRDAVLGSEPEIPCNGLKTRVRLEVVSA